MKKITYLVASLLLMGTTPMLTGCVDNDEPAGIEELRGAKAELLSAKAAVEAAKVATEQANAAYRNAQAEYEKAKAAREMAEAAKLQAEADKMNSEAQTDAAAAAQKLEEAKAKAEQAAKMWEVSYQKAQAEYQNMLVMLATQQSYEIDRALDSYKQEVKNTKIALERSAKNLRTKQHDLDDALAELEEDEAKKELNTRELQREVTVAERKVEGTELALAEAKEAYEEAQNMKLADVAVKRDELKAEIAKLEKEVLDLKVAAAEKVCEYQQTLGAENRKLLKEYQDMRKEEIQIPAFSLKVNGAFPNGVQGSCDAEAAVYTLSNNYSYSQRLSALESLQKRVLSWVRDEDGNDDLWTAERIAKWKKGIENLTKELEATKKSWKEAVAAYNTNQADVTDPTKITGYAELKTAVDNYNVAATAWNAVIKKIVDAKHAKQAAKDAYEVEKGKIDKARNDAYNAADDAYNETDKKIPEQAKTEAAKLKKAVDDAQSTYNAAVEAENKNTDPDKVTDLYLATKKAELALAQAQADLKTEDDLRISLENENFETHKKARDKADTEHTKSLAAAEKTRDDAVTEQETIIDELESEYNVATKTLDEAVAAIRDEGEAYDVFYTNAQGTTLKNGKEIVYAARNARKEGNPYAKQLNIKDLTELSKAALTNVIQLLSNKLYGTELYADNEYMDDNGQGDFEARLIEISEATIKEKAQEKLKKEEVRVGKNGSISYNFVYLSDYREIYSRYGLTGELMSTNELIALAEKWITNDEDVAAVVETVQKALDDLKATQEAAEEAAFEKYEAYQDGRLALEDKIAETNQPAIEAEAKNQPRVELLNKYEELIVEYTSKEGVDGNLFDEKALAQYVKECKAAITTAEDDLYDAETALMNAKQDLADYKSKKKSEYDLAAKNFEEAQAAYKIAEENYNAALEALNKKVAELSVE